MISIVTKVEVNKQVFGGGVIESEKMIILSSVKPGVSGSMSLLNNLQ